MKFRLKFLLGCLVAAFVAAPAFPQGQPVVTVDIITINGLTPPNERSGAAGTPIAIEALATGTDLVSSFTYSFFVNGLPIGTTPTINPPGTATANWTPPQPGSYFITVTATDGNNTATSLPVRFFATGTVVNSPVNNTLVPQGSSIVIKADATVGGGFIEQIQFYDNGAAIGTPDTTIPYSLIYTVPGAAGSVHNITAQATDNNGALVAMSLPITLNVVNAITPLPTCTISSPSNNAVIAVPTDPTVNIPIVVDAFSSSGRISKVELYVDGVLFSTKTSYPYEFAWHPAVVGPYRLVALAYDDKNNVVASTTSLVPSTTPAPTTVVVTARPSVTMITPTNGSTVTGGSPVSLKASATDPNTSYAISSVQFFVDGTFVAQTFIPDPGTNIYTFAATLSQKKDSSGLVIPSVITALATSSSGLAGLSPGVSVTVTSGGSSSPPPILPLPIVSVTAPTASSNLPVNVTTTIRANATRTTGNIASVQFAVNNTTLGITTVYPYKIDWRPTNPGVYAITATATDNDGNSVTSAVVSVNVVDPDPTAPTISITSPTNGATLAVNALQNLVANVTPGAGGSIGNVQFFVNGQPQGALLVRFPYTTPWTPTSAGTYTLTAIATNSTGNQTTAAPVVVTVGTGTPPAVSITSPTSGSTFGVGTALTVAASAADSDGTIAAVQFFVNGVALSTDTTSPYSVQWTPAATGSYTLTAVATDNLGNITTSAAVAVTIGANTPPTISLTSPANGLTFGMGSAVIVSAQAADVDGTVASVRFFANGQAIGTATTAPYQFSWVPRAAGTFVIFAQATDDVGNVTSSSSAIITITAGGAPTVTLTNPATGSTYGVGTRITLNATAASSNGPVAQVQFFVNGTSLLVDTSAPYSAAWTPVSAGTYSLVAVATDSAGISTTSAALAITITGVNAPTVTLTNPSAALRTSAGTAVALAANATSFSSTVAGVRFLANGFVIGTASTAPFTASWTPTAVGDYSIVAEATDAVGNVATTAPVVVTVVANQPPTVVLTAPASGGVLRVSSGVALRASASDPDGTIRQVQFVANGLAVGSSSAEPYTATWTPSAAGVYRLTAVATDNAGATITSSTVYVLVVSANLGANDTVYTGSYGWLSESGRFALVNLHGASVTFIGYSTTLPARLYYYPGLALDAGGGFGLTDASGNSLIRGSVSDSGVNGTLGSGASAIAFIVPVTLSGASPVAAGVYTGNISGNFASTLAAIVGSDGSIMLYVTDGAFRDAGSGYLTTTGNFSVTTATGARLVGRIDPATGFLTGTISGGATGSLVAANGSGVAFSDGVMKSLSTRGQAGVGENILIAGFIVNGTTSKNVLIRAVGPTMGAAPYNVAGVLADPQFDVVPVGSNVVIGGNDNWGGTAALQAAFSQVFAFALPTTSRDAAAILTLSPGGYTVRVSGVGNTTGVVIVEVYDLDSGDPFTQQKMGGVSTRGLVGAGDAVLIAGINVNGNMAKKVLVRAIGPALTGFGVSNALPDPILVIRKANNTVIRENNDWENGNDPALITEATVKCGISGLPSGSKDAVILMSLPPGLYTAEVRSATTATGVAIVEVYEVP